MTVDPCLAAAIAIAAGGCEIEIRAATVVMRAASDAYRVARDAGFPWRVCARFARASIWLVERMRLLAAMRTLDAALKVVQRITNETHRMVRLMLYFRKHAEESWKDWRVAALRRSPGWLLQTVGAQGVDPAR